MNESKTSNQATDRLDQRGSRPVCPQCGLRSHDPRTWRTAVHATTLYTIGIQGRPMAKVFALLVDAGVERLVDVRAENDKPDKAFFLPGLVSTVLWEAAGRKYEHSALLVPPPELFDALRTRRLGWVDFERQFLSLLAERRIEERLDRSEYAIPTALLGTRKSARCCHRRLVAEYVRQQWDFEKIVHL